LRTGQALVIVANLDTAIPWPAKLVKVTFRGRTLFLLPPTTTPLPNGAPMPSNETYPAIAVSLSPGETFDDGMRRCTLAALMNMPPCRSVGGPQYCERPGQRHERAANEARTNRQ
jgi:hypothetical protein